ncbi:Biotin carboxyl carrier protein of acetyl-CoA carboxylase [Candidatus Arsenophonus lipoptenae]|uniref:Biotin carboxyl carrier protein of acetyl-CoA carboxylase n=1 Tax=Candidatus Arsenophonus lipoptenae TaxID=634113 RepID=A0A109Q8U1_9GAMM|nr:acetyl-CoA carboxylase biotin carboxyl carrier protein [Candidatus Arsenophonus lipoptenae]AMA64995.1 Biotin carboxyl carrier protein of acetyl-CoA carboxylase [Candidatus Arsenophonus lipoptenae]
MDIRKIKKLIELVEKYDISKLEISEDGESIRINRKNIQNSSNLQHYMITKNTPQTNLLHHTEQNKILSENKSEKKTKIDDYIIRSPIVGTFYRAPNPKAKPFIEVGQRVKLGDPLCIIEAMKMMNQIETDKSGIIKAILLENGAAVEFEEPLVIIENDEATYA